MCIITKFKQNMMNILQLDNTVTESQNIHTTETLSGTL